MGRAPKSTKKFAASGRLKKTIQTRRRHQQIQKRAANRRGARNPKSRPTEPSNSDEDEGIEDTRKQENRVRKGQQRKSLDDLLPVGTDGADDSEEDEHADLDTVSIGQGSQDDESEDSLAEDGSFASVDDLYDEGKDHLLELSQLAAKDPEFFKYLQENDPELLEFDPDVLPEGDSDEASGDGDEDVMESDQDTPILTKRVVEKWQKALLKQRSLRALRKLLIAFRSAVHMNEEDQVLAWRFDDASVHNKVIMSALRYTPVVLNHHIPYKVLPDGKFKPPAQTPKFKTLQKLILSYFYNVIHLLSQLTDNNMIAMSVTEAVKLIPYVSSSRKAVKLYTKKCIELWSTAEDSVRMAALLAIRRIGASDNSVMDIILKSTYLALVRCSKVTNTFSLPSINFMKNSASEIFCIDHAMTYQHAFGHIRQLAIQLRNSMKIRSKDAFKSVYNWQYVHCIDFWAVVLSRACSSQSVFETGGSELKALIYPLVQVSLGAIKLISNARWYPFHLQIIRSLLHLGRHTGTYIPLPPHILPIIVSTLTPSSRLKSSTLRPLDLEVQIRTPQQYMKTRIYAENLVEEGIFLLAEWLTSAAVHGSVAFPEVSIPVTVALRRALKSSSKGDSSMVKEVGLVRGLVDRIEESARWMEQKRSTVTFSPGDATQVEDWELAIKGKIDETPMGKYLKVLQKTREKRRKLIDKARQGDDEILES